MTETDEIIIVCEKPSIVLGPLPCGGETDEGRRRGCGQDVVWIRTAVGELAIVQERVQDHPDTAPYVAHECLEVGE